MTRYEAILEELRQEGYQVVSCIFRYQPTTHFSTKLSLSGTLLDQEHGLLDAIREFMVDWSNLRHVDQLTWTKNSRDS